MSCRHIMADIRMRNYAGQSFGPCASAQDIQEMRGGAAFTAKQYTARCSSIVGLAESPLDPEG